MRLDSVVTTTTVSTTGALHNPWMGNYQNTLIGPWAPPAGGIITRFHVFQEIDWWTDIFTVYDADFNILWSYSAYADQWVSISGGTTELWTRLVTSDWLGLGGFGGDVDFVVTVSSIWAYTDSIVSCPTAIGDTDTLWFKVYSISFDSLLVVDSVTVTGDAFSVSTTSLNVTPGDSGAIAIMFTPDDMMTYQDSLTIYTNDPRSPEVSVCLSGIGTTNVAVSPAQNALNVPLDSPISITFDVDMNPATINENTFIVHGSYTGKLGGAYAYDSDTKTATFTPTSPFKVDEQVNVTLTTGITCAAGDTLAGPMVWDFTSEVLEGTGIFTMSSLPGIGGGIPGDWDLDGDIDLISSGTVFLNDGFGDFANANSVTSPNIAGDWDNDGDLDLAWVNYSLNSISISLNDGFAGFTPAADLSVGSNPLAINHGDWNGDGYEDFAVANQTENTVSILLNNGVGTFVESSRQSVGAYPTAIAVADWDIDGDLDMAIANDEGHSISILLNNGRGSFAPTPAVSVAPLPYYPRAIASGDWDNDGDIDLITGNWGQSGDGSYSILQNDGNGIFTETVTQTVDTFPGGYATGDWDNDNDIDIVTSSLIFTNDGNGLFTLTTNSGGNTSADWDGDGDLDLVGPGAIYFNRNRSADIALFPDTLAFSATKIGSTDSLTFNVYNHGMESTLQVTNIAVSSPVFMHIPNNFSVPPGDSATVIVTFTPTDMVTYNDSLTIFSNDPQNPETKVYLSGIANPIISTYPAQNALNVPLDCPISVTFGVDMNPATINANTFVVHGSYTGKLSGSYNTVGNIATFTPDRLFKVGEQVSVTLTTGVQTQVGDGLPSAFSWGFCIELIGGSGTFSSEIISSVGSSPISIITGDWDQDGDLDLATVNNDSPDGDVISIVTNMGSGIFVRTAFLQTGYGVGNYSITSGDWDADNDIDLVVIDEASSTVSVFKNNGTGTFLLASSPSITTHGPTSITVGDWEGDGDLDLAVAQSTGASLISILTNEGSGTFYETLLLYVGSDHWSITSGDWDIDGDKDLAVGNYDDSVSIIFNDGEGNFLQSYSSAVLGPKPIFLAPVDADSDGDLDLTALTGGAVSALSFLRNNGDGIFPSAAPIDAIDVGNEPVAMSYGDWDGDGAVDLVVAYANADTISFFCNNGNGAFAWESTLHLYENISSFTVGDWDQDGDFDIAAVNNMENSLAVLLNQDIFSARFTLDTQAEHSDSLTIPYIISNPDSNTTSLLCEYSDDDGATWHLATIIGDTTGLGPDKYQGTLLWDSYVNLPDIDLTTVRFKITPYDQTGEGRAYTTPAFHLDNNRIPTAVLTPVAEGEYRGDIAVGYQLSDAENDTLRVQCEYLAPKSAVWHPATITGNTSGITSSAYAGSLIWNSAPDQPQGMGYYYFRIIPYDNDQGAMDTITILIDQLCVPFATAISNFDTEQSGDIEIAYTLADDENDTLSIVGDYSEDSGQNWALASIEGKTTNLLPAEYSGSFIWQSGIDLGGVDKTAIRFRITPHDANPGLAIETQDFHLDNNDPPTVVTGAINDTIISRVSIHYTLTDAEGDSLTLSASYSLDQGASWQEGHLDYARGKIAPAGYTGTIDWLAFADLTGKHTDVQLKVVPTDNDPGVGDTLTGLTVIYYPGDYTGNLAISTDDLAEFAAAWNSVPQDLTHEIGPAAGIVPDLLPQPDGVIDFEDLTVFAMMWNWSFAHNGFARSISVLAKVISENTTIRLVQRIPEDLYQWDGFITVDMFVAEAENLMMVDGFISYGSGGLQLMGVADGGYLRQFFKATPLLTQVGPDSSQALFALAGLGTLEPGKVDDLPVATLRLKPKVHELQPLILDYTLTGMDGGPFETGQLQIEVENLMPREFALHQNYPNPFNPITTIRFDLPKATKVYLVVYDILGREVTRLRQEQLGAGYHQVLWAGRDQAGRDLASGIYFARLVIPEYTKTVKMLLLK
ncbi:MAG: VCBS repeat-containing protein [Fidelibacterota bacterium]|nr:MAG: VCBS repeat-containing protein [Candidatus Neomarinimicrobiota bacterium]